MEEIVDSRIKRKWSLLGGGVEVGCLERERIWKFPDSTSRPSASLVVKRRAKGGTPIALAFVERIKGPPRVLDD